MVMLKDGNHKKRWSFKRCAWKDTTSTLLMYKRNSIERDEKSNSMNSTYLITISKI